MIRILLVFLCVDSVFGQPISLKTHNEILASFSTATNVDGRSKLIQDYYQARRSVLPQKGKIDELSSLGISSTIGLASLFCKLMIAKDAELATGRWAHEDLNFTLAPAQALSTDNLKIVLHSYGKLFLQRELYPEEVLVLVEFAQEMIQELPQEGPSTQQILTVLCSSIGGSPESLMGLKY